LSPVKAGKNIKTARKSLEEQRRVETLEAIDSVKSDKLIEEKS